MFELGAIPVHVFIIKAFQLLYLVADLVRWSPSGDSYIIVVNNKIDVYSVQVRLLNLTLVLEQYKGITIYVRLYLSINLTLVLEQYIGITLSVRLFICPYFFLTPP